MTDTLNDRIEAWLERVTAGEVWMSTSRRQRLATIKAFCAVAKAATDLVAETCGDCGYPVCKTRTDIDCPTHLLLQANAALYDALGRT